MLSRPDCLQNVRDDGLQVSGIDLSGNEELFRQIDLSDLVRSIAYPDLILRTKKQFHILPGKRFA